MRSYGTTHHRMMMEGCFDPMRQTQVLGDHHASQQRISETQSWLSPIREEKKTRGMPLALSPLPSCLAERRETTLRPPCLKGCPPTHLQRYLFSEPLARDRSDSPSLLAPRFEHSFSYPVRMMNDRVSPSLSCHNARSLCRVSQSLPLLSKPDVYCIQDTSILLGA